MNLTTSFFVIAFDLDDVLWHFNQTFLDWYNLKFNKQIKLSDLKKNMLGEALGISEEDAIKVVWQFCHSPAHQQIVAAKRAYDFLSFVVRHKHCALPISVTSRSEELQSQTDWLVQKWFPGIEFAVMRMLGTYHNYGQSKEICKSDVCLEHGAHLVFEDSFDNAAKIAEKGIPVILFNQPWNIDCDEKPHSLITRTDGFTDEVWKIFHYYRACHLDGHYVGSRLIPYNLHMRQVRG